MSSLHRLGMKYIEEYSSIQEDECYKLKKNPNINPITREPFKKLYKDKVLVYFLTQLCKKMKIQLPDRACYRKRLGLSSSELKNTLLKCEKFSKIVKIDDVYLMTLDKEWIIVNNKGHWIVVGFDNIGEYFDSLGKCPPKEILEFFKKSNIDKYIYNEYRFQKKNTSTCGFYVIFFIFMRCLENKTFEEVIEMLKEKDDPDEFVNDFVDSLQNFVVISDILEEIFTEFIQK